MPVSHRPSSAFSANPWKEIDLDRFPQAMRVPTMLSPAEQRFYIWITRDWVEGSGSVVDLGAFVGGSTARLADGARSAGKKPDIHAYDKFTAQERTKRRQLYEKGVPAFEGEDVFPLARGFLDPWEDLVSLHRGKIEEIGWQGGPIEVLVIDAFKNAALVDAMVGAFFPALVPGRSLLVHQDFLHWKQPWICAQMARFGDLFEPVAVIAPDSVAFLLRGEITPGALRDARVSALGDDEIQSAIDEMRARLSGLDIDNRLDAMAEGLRANPGVRAAWRMKRPGSS